ncbi:BolA-like protein [Chloropicon primus]|uniref:BolA-like protein n=1 Tax=Chloropicon primus TaxID=1764295 RepID=A0A5B8MJL7_9CHLO|nr:BolA-like protein [Chloropicon primus]UPQ98792.1 BolA-like protein [Chloropicon primus]|eukprot:QDZ19580.1 BolA-like protein [Chloropicon primus]
MLSSTVRAVKTTLGGVRGVRMAVTVAQVEQKLKEALQAQEIEVFDTSGGCGASFEVSLLVSEQFEGKRALQRHRLINGVLAEELKEIHALSIKKTLTPEEFKTK